MHKSAQPSRIFVHKSTKLKALYVILPTGESKNQTASNSVMAEHNKLGQVGEEEACRYLAEHHYRLLARNWHAGHLELDIVSDYFGELVFVEVKTRRHERIANAADAVDLEKKKNLLKAAYAYMAAHKIDQPFRFDIITVIGEQRPFKIHQIVNAFDRMTVSEGHSL